MTMYDTRNKLSTAVFEELHRYFPAKVFRTVIPRNVKLAEAPSHGLPVKDYDPESAGAIAYRRLALELDLSKIIK
jgi:chromosome partitioning protein